MNKIKKSLAILLTLAMVLSVTIPAALAAGESYDVSITGKTAAAVEAEIQNMLNDTSAGDTVTVIGSKTDEVETITLDIPEDVTLVWTAESSGLCFEISGGGTFEVAEGGKIEIFEDFGMVIRVTTGNVTVSGGSVSGTGQQVSVIDVDYGDIIISGGEVLADGEYHVSYAASINYFGTIMIIGGTVTALGEYDPPFAIYSGGGLAAYLAGTCTGNFLGHAQKSIIVEVDSLDIPTSRGGTNDGLTHKAGAAIDTVIWDVSGQTPVISFDHGAYTIPWKVPEVTPPAPPVKYAVRHRESGELFTTLNQAIAAVKGAGHTSFVLEVIGDVSETSNVIIDTEHVTIVGAEGAHTFAFSEPAPGEGFKFSVEGGGTLTLGEGQESDILTIAHTVLVTNGSIHVNDGVTIKGASIALRLIGADATGAITGGRFEGIGIPNRSGTGLDLSGGARITEISGGVFVGNIDAAHVSDLGTRIETISGGAFYQTDPNTTLHGSAVFLQNDAEIGEISGGYFESSRTSALAIARGAKVDEISGGDFVMLPSGTSRSAAIWMQNGSESEGFVGSTIGTISGGHMRGGIFGVMSVAGYGECYLNYITGGTIEGIVALQNDKGSIITEISGGEIIGDTGILNASSIGTISGDVKIQGNDGYGIFNYTGGIIDEISGGMIVSNDDAITNSGTIDLISGGTFIGRFSALYCSSNGAINTITNGVFWGTYSEAIVLANAPVRLEPGLDTQKGLGRYWGMDGKIFNKESLVNYPSNAKLDETYFMSTEAEAVAGITETQFKYLRLSVLVPTYTVTYDPGEHGTFTAVTHSDLESGTATPAAPDALGESNWIFTGWLPEVSDTVTQDITYIAQWKSAGKEDPKPVDPTPTDPKPVVPPVTPFIADHLAYIIGYPEGDVRPNNNILRSEVATVFFRLLTEQMRADHWTQSNPYPDVSTGQWFNNAISVMSSMGIVKGCSDGTFQPNAAITRAELAAIAARFAKLMDMAPTNDLIFSDVAGHWAQADIQYAAAIGWVNGYPDGMYRPEQNITRAEFMTLVNRMLGRAPETAEDLLHDDMVIWADNADVNAWYYLAVQEATNSHKPEYKTGRFVPGLKFEYERWTEMTTTPDWSKLETAWATAHSIEE